jgi:hypothetical protein
MISAKLCAVCMGAFMAALISGCGDKPMLYKQGQYQGKLDNQPWDNAQFKGNQVEWEKAIKARNQGQDENSRAVASAK